MDNKKLESYLDKQTGILFVKNNLGIYNPMIKDFDIEEMTGVPLSAVMIYRELVDYVNWVRRYVDKKTQKKKSLPLFPFQWSCLIDCIESLRNPASQQFLWAISRQGGKSTLLEILISFAITILPKYVDTDSLRYTAILGSYKDDAVKELFKKIKPFIYKAVEYYNKRNKDQLLIWKDDKSLKLKDNDDLVEIDKKFQNGEVIPYAQARSITCGAVNDGYTAEIMCIDESGLIKADLFKTSMANFTSATAGITVYSGVPNEDSSSLFYDKKKDKVVKTLLYDYPLVSMMKGMVSEKLKKKYDADYKSKVSGSLGGERSSFIRWNYYLDTEDASGKFISRTALDINLVNDIKIPTGANNRFKVGGIDVSAGGDFKVMTVGETTLIRDNETTDKRKGGIVYKFVTDICNIHTFNKLGKMQSTERFAEMCAEKCVEYKLDCVAIDSSSAGGMTFTQLFRKYLDRLGALNKVMILPYSYNQNKQTLFWNLERALHDGNIRLLKEDCSWESEKLVEELGYFLRKPIPGTTRVKYEAPKGKGFTDDHCNSLALTNICAKEIYERSLDSQKRIVKDGSGAIWAIWLRRWDDVEEEANKKEYEKAVIKSWLGAHI